MSKLFAVFGATGNQGGSVINAVLDDPSLAKQFSIRAITRDVSSHEAQALAQRVEVVVADVLSPTNIASALAGVHTIFLMSTPTSGPDAVEEEFATIKSTVDIAVAQGVQYIIFSTLPPISQISGGKFSRVAAFDAKAKAEEYIRSLPVQSAFYCPGSFMENFLHPATAGIRQLEDGSCWVMERHVAGTTQLPLIDAVSDTGKFVAAILAEPDKYAGKVLRAAVKFYSLEEIVQCLSRATGKKVVYRQTPLRGPVEKPSFWEALLSDYFSYLETWGYFGTGQSESMEWSTASTKGRLSTFEEFLVAHPIKLE